MIVPALTLFVLAATGAVGAWMVLALVLVRGTIVAIDNPARQSFVVEIVGADRVVNAVALNSVVVHCSRILGPACAGTIIALIGHRALFPGQRALVPGDVHRAADDGRRRSCTRRSRRRGSAVRCAAALRYVRRTPELLIPLAMMALVGTISFNFQVLLPLLGGLHLARHRDTYALLTAAMGVGSVAGALAAGARGRVSRRAARRGLGAVRHVLSCWPRSRRRWSCRSWRSCRWARPA